jgi:GNAT superfamily N-acetyltransferase
MVLVAAISFRSLPHNFACSKISASMRTTGGIEIRAADSADAVAISGCLLEAFTPYRSAYTPAAFADTVPSAHQVRIRLGQMHVLVATVAGAVVGTISAATHGEEGYLRGMAVLPTWRGTGTSAMLLASIENWLRSRGCRQITLGTTEPLETAIAFYEKHGYRRSGKVSDFFGMRLIAYVKTDL